MVGLINEMAGEQGFAWHCRVILLDTWASQIDQAGQDANPMFKEYGLIAIVVSSLVFILLKLEKTKIIFQSFIFIIKIIIVIHLSYIFNYINYETILEIFLGFLPREYNYRSIIVFSPFYYCLCCIKQPV